MTEINWINLLSISAIISTVLQFLTGVLVCQKYIQKKSTGESSSLPFCCGFLSCSFWLTYGCLKEDTVIILVNVIGAVLFFLYIMVFYVFTINKTGLLKQFSFAVCTIVSALFYCIQYERNLENAIQAIGILCCTVTVLYFAAPLTLLLHVIKVKNSESLPYPLILSSFFVTLQWYIYGILIDDAFVQVPNLLGCILGSAQLSLFVIYPSRKHGPQYKPLQSEDY